MVMISAYMILHFIFNSLFLIVFIYVYMPVSVSIPVDGLVYMYMYISIGISTDRCPESRKKVSYSQGLESQVTISHLMGN